MGQLFRGPPARVFLIATLVAVFLTLITRGAPGGLLARGAYMFGTCWTAAALVLVLFRISERWPLVRGGSWRRGVFIGLSLFAPMALVAWTLEGLLFPPFAPLARLPRYFATSLLISAFVSSLAVMLNRTRAPEAAAGDPPPEVLAVKFRERLPGKLKDAEIWAVEAEDHYLRLHTSLGQDLILFRLADAIGELEGVEGAQVHRSWWVARAGVAEARRGDGRAVLTLKNGAEAPVSRTYARALREKGWI